MDFRTDSSGMLGKGRPCVVAMQVVIYIVIKSEITTIAVIRQACHPGIVCIFTMKYNICTKEGVIDLQECLPAIFGPCGPFRVLPNKKGSQHLVKLCVKDHIPCGEQGGPFTLISSHRGGTLTLEIFPANLLNDGDTSN